jgi:hypothetical protein
LASRLANAIDVCCEAYAGVGEGVTVLVAPLDPQLAAPDHDAPKPLASQTQSTDPIPDPERNSTMKPTDTNGAHNRRDATPDEPPDPLAAAEELRDALSDVLAKAIRPIRPLRRSVSSR